MNRRSILGMIAATPFAAKAAQQRRLAGSLVSPPSHPYPHPGGYEALQGLSTATEANRITPPKMPEWKATQLVLADPRERAKLTSALYEQHRVVSRIDPDIEVMRSWSPMFKITMQRQRNVEQQLEALMSEPYHQLFASMHEAIRKVMYG